MMRAQHRVPGAVQRQLRVTSPRARGEVRRVSEQPGISSRNDAAAIFLFPARLRPY
jgi:hypothetical protein